MRISDLVKPQRANVCVLSSPCPPGPRRPGLFPGQAPRGGSQVSALSQDPTSAFLSPQTETPSLQMFRSASWSYSGRVSPTPHHMHQYILSAPPSKYVQNPTPLPLSGLSLPHLLPGSLPQTPHWGPHSYYPPLVYSL